MNKTAKELASALAELAFELEAEGDQHWADWMKRALVAMEESPRAGALSALGAYGGMGSFNDTGYADDSKVGILSSRVNLLAKEIV